MLENCYLKSRVMVMAMIGTLWVSAPVWGDDTEIFFGNFDGGGVQPNVLFVMDTSGSMRGRPNASNPTPKIQIVQEALRQLANEMTGVNVGLMRFSNPGGPVLYAVTDIDAEISNFGTGAQTVISRPAGVSDDATEVLDTGEVTLTRPTGAAGGGALVVAENFRVEKDDDDTYGNTGTLNQPYQNYLYLYGVNTMLGVRFGEAEIPIGARVTRANVSLTAHPWDSNNVGSLDVVIAGDPPPAADFDSPGADGPGERAQTANTQVWTMNTPSGALPTSGTVLTSPDISPIIQEIIDSPDWLAGGFNENDIALLMTQLPSSDTNARRLFESYDLQPGSTTLSVEYIPSGTSSTTFSFASGVRFPAVNVPRNATITSATLELMPRNTLSGPQVLEIGLEASSSPAQFSDTTGSLAARLGAVSSQSFPVAGWTAGSGVSIDVTSMVAARTGQSGWCGGRDLSFLLSAPGDLMEWVSYDGLSGETPVLRVTYDADSIVPGNTCIEGQQSARVARSADDVVAFNPAASSYRTNQARMRIRNDDWGAFRFDGFQMPADAVVSSAHLYLTAYGSTTNSGVMNISVESTADSEPLNISGGPGGRTWSGSVPWSIGGSNSWVDRREYRSPDISGLINTALSSGFVAGNAITLRVDRASGTTRNISSFDRNPIYAPRLEVTFQSAGNDAFNTARTEFVTAVDSLSAEGFTPIQDTMFEAYQYYAGNPVTWGKFRGGHDPAGNRINVANEGVDAEPFWYTRVSVQESVTPESWGGVVRPAGCTDSNLSSTSCDDPNGSGQPEGEYLAGNPIYRTPINNQCQFESHIVFLTDGAANEPHSESLIQSEIGVGSCPSSSNRSQACVVELAEYMANNDMNPLLEGDQRVVTHMVGFDFDEAWLENIAAAGDGVYATADSLDGLVEEFRAIIAEVLKTDTSFVAPVAAINQFNRLTNLDSVYFAVFKPDAVPAWAGNLKRYRLGQSGDRTNVLLDANDNPALDPNTGFFSGSAQSYWSSGVDGTEVTAGGAGEQVPGYASRNVFTDTGTTGTLTASSNAVVSGNSNLTAAMLGVASADREGLINWIRGMDTEDEDGDGTTSEDRYALNDPLHSRPVAITYGLTSDFDGDGQPDPDVTIFFGTNAGNLHAINANTGEEIFTYIPQELLELQADIRANDGSTAHYYGLDGSASVWTINQGSNAISTAEGDRVILYIGQRRGGRNFYAIDVTDRNSPRLLWKIQGGTGDYADLGETWPRAIPGRLRVSGTERDVLYLSGGYDPINDNETTRSTTPDSMGNAIYIVDALTGAKIWSVGSGSGHELVQSAMTHAIPATVSAYDVNSDGLDDGMFVGDVGGQVWRFDFNQGAAPATLVTGGVIARLGAGGEMLASQNRRFYHSPDVALVEVNGAMKLAVTIGSGSRPSPLSTAVEDRFYAIFQDAVFGPPSAYVPIFDGDDTSTPATETSGFYDATDNLIQTGTVAEVAAERLLLANAAGWQIRFERAGEKVLSTPLSARDSVLFATYEPVNDPDSCTPKAGTSRAYVVSLTDATAALDLIGDVTPTPPSPTAERYTDLSTSSIVDEPVIICTEDGCDVFVGPEQFELPIGEQINRTYWRQDQ